MSKYINLEAGTGFTCLFMIHSETKIHSRWSGVNILTFHRAFAITISVRESAQLLDWITGLNPVYCTFWKLEETSKYINLVDGTGFTWLFMIRSETKLHSRWLGVNISTLHRAFTITIPFGESAQLLDWITGLNPVLVHVLEARCNVTYTGLVSNRHAAVLLT